METLVVAQHRDQYYSRKNGVHGLARCGSFGSPPSTEYKGITCRNYQSGTGLLPTPLKSKSCTSTNNKRAYSASISPKTASPVLSTRSEYPKNVRKLVRSNAISIPIKMNLNVCFAKESVGCEFHFSELWAGPTYSNSPPPSSLPIPKFSLKPKRTVSLELPSSLPVVDLRPIAKSAPASPTRERSLSPMDLFGGSVGKTTEDITSPRDPSDDADSATKTLRRILNLDVTDE